LNRKNHHSLKSHFLESKHEEVDLCRWNVDLRRSLCCLYYAHLLRERQGGDLYHLLYRVFLQHQLYVIL